MYNPPSPRYETAVAIEQLATDLNLPNERWMQDWAYIVSIPQHIDKYISHYKKLSDDDQKFALMMLILQALEEQDNQIDKYKSEVSALLQQEYPLHAYTIFHWCSFDNEDLSDCWEITPMMREIFLSNNVLKESGEDQLSIEYRDNYENNC
ncbi:TPA: hypothetical protein SMM93_000469 [Proteus mirabilis]